MNEMNFIDKVRKHFDYLESEYGFKLSRASNSDIRPHTDGVVEYISDSMVVVIDSETGYAAVWFYRIKDGRKHDLDPVSIFEYLNTNDEERKLLLSTDPEDYRAASILSNEKSLLNQPAWKSEDGILADELEMRLENYASWLRSHANLCLRGDFSQWVKFYEYKTLRARANELRRGKDELVYVMVKDADGKSKLVKQSAFKDDFEYIEMLKKEFPE